MNYDNQTTTELKLQLHKMLLAILGQHAILPTTLTRQQTIDLIERLFYIEQRI